MLLQCDNSEYNAYLINVFCFSFLFSFINAFQMLYFSLSKIFIKIFLFFNTHISCPVLQTFSTIIKIFLYTYLNI